MLKPTPGWRSVPGAVRVASHLAVWTAVLVPMFSELSRGWRPFSDDAAIASRAYQTLSLHPPLTGLATAASLGTGHALYDPGPLLFYVLAVPVHLDPAHGLFWGAALCCGAVLSLAIEAAWSLGAWMIGAVVALGVLDLVWLTPAVFENLPWNAYFPLPFLTAALVLAWVVVMGRTRWWPVLVVAASVAAQSHLLFVVPAVGLVVVAGVFGLMAGRPRRYGWLVVGLGLGLLCWLAPLIQELGAHPNLTVLITSGRGQSTLGMGFGLRMVGLAGAPHPIWLTHLPSGFYKMAEFEYGHAPWYGGVILGLLAVVTVAAFVTGRRPLGALGAVGSRRRRPGRQLRCLAGQELPQRDVPGRLPVGGRHPRLGDCRMGDDRVGPGGPAPSRRCQMADHRGGRHVGRGGNGRRADRGGRARRRARRDQAR